jgi:hypothetical protein
MILKYGYRKVKLNLWSKIRFSALEDELAREVANTFNFSTCNILAHYVSIYSKQYFIKCPHIYKQSSSRMNIKLLFANPNNATGKMKRLHNYSTTLVIAHLAHAII